MDDGDNRVEHLMWVEDREEGDNERFRMITVFPDNFERCDDGSLYGWEGDSVDLSTALCTFHAVQQPMLMMQSVQQHNVGLKVVQVGTEKVVARLELNPPDRPEKNAAFAALSTAIEATSPQLPEEMYRQLYEKAKAAFDACARP